METHAITKTQFCDEHKTIDCSADRETNLLPAYQFDYALVEISPHTDYLLEIQKEVVETLNELFRDLSGKVERDIGDEKTYTDIGQFILTCFENGLRGYQENEYPDPMQCEPELEALEQYKKQVEQEIREYVGCEDEDEDEDEGEL